MPVSYTHLDVYKRQAVAAFINGLTGRKSDVIMDGGTVTIKWDEISGHILMTGPATKVFDGEIEDKY